jgi:hypothetical protein
MASGLMKTKFTFLHARTDEFVLSRRLLFWSPLWPSLGASLAATALTAAPFMASATAAMASTPPEQLRLLMRLMASTGKEMVPWYYTGRIYAVRSGVPALHLYNFEGTEIYWVTPDGPDRWSVAASTLTFYRDRISGGYLDRFDNPVTGKTVEITPNVLRSRHGQGAVYAPGNLSLMGESQPVAAEMQRNGGLFWLTTSRVNSHGVQPSMEVSTMMCSTADADDAHRRSIRSSFTSTSLSPWSRWLEMGEQEGHLVWHGAGRKLSSLAEIPADYRQRADALHGPHFTDPESGA